MTRIDLVGPDVPVRDAMRQRARRTAAIAGLVAAWSLALPAVAAPPAKDAAALQCAVPDATAFVDGPLPRLARRLKSGDPLTIVVLGSGSAAGNGTSRKEAAFPSRLEGRLEKAYPRARVKLVVLAEVGQTAPAMRARFAREVIPLKPALVVWQTGSADVARGVPVTEFSNALEQGIAELKDAGIDVLLVDSQFGPRASLLINTDSYREAVRWGARRYDLPLFKRYDTMQYWWSNEIFDLDAADKASQLENADRIHDCVAVLLLKVIQRGTGVRAAS